MKKIPLTQGFVALVDDEDYERLAQFNWHANRFGTRYYAVRHGKGSGKRRPAVLMHREIMRPPAHLEIDHREHREHERLVDNRRSNLIVCTKSVNQQNRTKNRWASSIFKGVSLTGGELARGGRWKRWVANISLDGRRTYLGCFTREADAALAYDLAALRMFGANARTNFPVPGSSRWIFGEAE